VEGGEGDEKEEREEMYAQGVDVRRETEKAEVHHMRHRKDLLCMYSQHCIPIIVSP
jgi:hypothetical protein